MQTKEPQDFKSGTTQAMEEQTEKPQDLKGRGQEEKEPQKIQEQGRMEIILAIEEELSKIQPLGIKPHTELVKRRLKL